MSSGLSLNDIAALEEASQAGAPAMPQYAAARPQDLAVNERLVRARLPTLEFINERAQDPLAAAISSFSGLPIKVVAKPPVTMAYSDLTKRLPVPTNINIVDIQGFKGASLVAFSAGLIYSIVDRLFGGTGKLIKRVKEGDFSDTELRLSRRLLQSVTTTYAKEWDLLPNMAFSLKKQVSNPQFVAILAPTDLVVISAFEVYIDDAQNPVEMLFCFPNSAIEPVRAALATPLIGDISEAVKPWDGKIKAGLAQADLDLAVELGSLELTLGDLSTLEVGDFIALDRQKVVDASVDKEVLFRCKYGVTGARYAIEIIEIVAPPPEEWIGDVK